MLYLLTSFCSWAGQFESYLVSQLRRQVVSSCRSLKWTCIYEPPHDKTKKLTVRPAKTRISLGIRPVWSESFLCAQWVAEDRSFLQADSEDSDQTGWMPWLIWVFADWVDAQADLSLRWAHRSFCWFCHEAAHICMIFCIRVHSTVAPWSNATPASFEHKGQVIKHSFIVTGIKLQNMKP